MYGSIYILIAYPEWPSTVRFSLAADLSVLQAIHSIFCFASYIFRGCILKKMISTYFKIFRVNGFSMSGVPLREC